MNPELILDDLNDAQRHAVCAPLGHQLILAGAGSGKTRVLVHRLAWLVHCENISPFGLLAVTFTNKAAAEMRQRVETLLNLPAQGLWVGTFHGICHRLLRMHWQAADLPQTFQILDSQDQQRLVKRVLKNLDLDENQWPAKQAQWFINHQKDEGLRAKQIPDSPNPVDRQLLKIYRAYEETCQRMGVIDFAELLLRVLEMLRKHSDILQQYQHRFQYLLVDEFQDTNRIQYDFLKLLAGKTAHIFAVGDDDQSIYGWRGAQIENIQNFARDFPNVSTVRLEQNYRSTGNILKAANQLIRNNSGRLGKELWTGSSDGAPVYLYPAYNEIDEARFVAERVQRWINQGDKRSDIAVLYRSNAQSRVFEEVFITQSIPYRVYGGLRFFERAEIKDALAYLRLCGNRDDDASFERVVNQPTRGIGERTLDQLREYAKHHQISLWHSTVTLLQNGVFKARAASALNEFIALIEALANAIISIPLQEQVDHVVQKSGLYAFFADEKGEKAQVRKENLEELVSAARGFEYDKDNYDGMAPLDAFLAHAVLESGETQGDAWEDCVQMMTLHSAKGLEFPLVILCGLEEGLFPHQMSMQEDGRLEEERRLCYVGITRARQQLILTYAETRQLYGREHYGEPSRFLAELPQEIVESLRTQVLVSKPLFNAARQNLYANKTSQNNKTDQKTLSESDSSLYIGQRVMHQKFGEGVVLNCEGHGSHARVQVNFEREGSKWLVLSYANLETI